MSDISKSSNIISIIISIRHNYCLNSITNKSRTQNIPVFLFDRIDGSTLMVRTIWLRFAAKFIISNFWVPITNSRRIFSHKIWRIYNISKTQVYRACRILISVLSVNLQTVVLPSFEHWLIFTHASLELVSHRTVVKDDPPIGPFSYS